MCLSYVMRILMFKNVDQKKIALRLKQTLEALEDIEAGRIIDGEEVMNWLSSWGAGDEQEQPEG